MTKTFVCEQCGSHYTYVTKEYRVCRKCGYRKKIEEIEKEEQDVS